MKFAHANITVVDLENSINFYKTALDLDEDRRKDFGNCIMVYLCDGKSNFELELRFNKGVDKKINLGDNPTHLAFVVENYAATLEKHKALNCITSTNAAGMHFIKDPDGYSLEIMSKDFLEMISAKN